MQDHEGPLHSGYVRHGTLSSVDIPNRQVGLFLSLSLVPFRDNLCFKDFTEEEEKEEED